jgi:hypothetical protein
LAANPDEDSEDVRFALLSDFVAIYGSRPFANRKVGKKVPS